MAPHSSTLAWKIPWTEEPGRLQSMGSLRVGRLSDFTFTFHFHVLEKEMATHSSVLAWRIPGTGESGGLPSMGSHRVGSNLAAAAGNDTPYHMPAYATQLVMNHSGPVWVQSEQRWASLMVALGYLNTLIIIQFLSLPSTLTWMLDKTALTQLSYETQQPIAKNILRVNILNH